jgi:hypothetical protein
MFKDREQFIREGRRENPNFDIPDPLCGMVCGEGGNYAIGVFDGLPTTIVHESAHLAFTILQYHGLDPTDSHGEAFCYLQECIFQRFTEFLKPRKKKR